MTTDDWYWVLQLFSAGIALLAVAALVGTTLVGRRINNRDSKRLVALETDLVNAKLALAKQEELTADAQEALLKLQERVKPRALSAKFTDALQGKRPGTVTIWHLLDDGEAFQFGIQLHVNLAVAKWTVAWPESIPPGKIRSYLRGMSAESRAKSPTLMLVGAQMTGITLVANSNDDPACTTLAEALVANGFGIATTPDEALPPNTVEIIVGPKP